MLNIKNLLIQILNTLTLKSGATMTNELKTSNGDVIIGSGQIGEEAGLTISEFVAKVRYSSGAVGSVKINNSSAGGYTFNQTWYNYFYIPHRFGADSGNPRGQNNDNHNYGNIILCSMLGAGYTYNIRVSGGNIAEVTRLDASLSFTNSTVTPASVSTTNYSLETSANRTNIKKSGRAVFISIGVTAKSPVKWSSTFANGFPVPMQAPVYGALGCDSDGSNMAVSIDANGNMSGAGGVANKLYYGTIYYIAAS